MEDKTAAQQIDAIIDLHGGWKGDTLSRLRNAIKRADPAIVEEVKWKMPTRPEGLPVWSHDGIVCIAEIFKNDIKLVFFKGALMGDLQNFFNARLNSKTDRAIEFREGDRIDEAGITQLVQEAVKINQARVRKR